MPMNLQNVSKNIFIFVSVEWQCQIYARIINSSKFHNLSIKVITLRSGLDTNEAWSSIERHDISFFDLSHNYKLSKLGLIDSVFSSKKIRYCLLKMLPKNSLNDCILITDNLFRVHEMSFLSITSTISRIIVLPHGLTKKIGLSKAKSFFTSKLRLLILFYIPRLIYKLRFFSISSKIKNVTFEKDFKNNNSFFSGNLQVKNSIDRLLEIKKDYKETENILFMSSGSFRYPNDVYNNQPTLSAIKFVNKYCKKNNKNLFLKFKQDEGLEYAKNFQDNPNITILDETKNYIELINDIQPAYIFCSHLSTIASELLLSGYQVVIYNSGVFSGIAKSYAEIYRDLNLSLQDLNSNDLCVVSLKNKDKKNKLEKMIGCSKVNFNLIDECT